MARILITGAAGFIGGHLYTKLKSEGHEVIGIDNFSHPSKNPVNKDIYIADIRAPNRGLAKKADWLVEGALAVQEYSLNNYIQWADIVYHLAAQIHVDKSIENPDETVNININGTLNILEACRKYNKKLVFASSSEVYGSSQTELMAETHPLDAQSPYAASKVGADRLCKAYVDTYGMDIAILRNFNTFGPYQNDGGEGKSYGAVIGIFTKSALRNEPLTVFGDGEQRRDYIYITDALKGYELASNYRGCLNIGSGQTVSINELAEKIIHFTKSKSNVIHIAARAGEVRRLCADISLARTLGFRPETDFDKHLEEYIQWYTRTQELAQVQ